MGSYTYQRYDNILNLFGKDGAAAWQRLQAIPVGEIAKSWKNELNTLAAEYHYSPRFSLMRIMEARGKSVPIAKTERVDEQGFALNEGGREFAFPHVTIDYTQSLSDAENDRWVALLRAVAAAQQDADAQMADSLIARAWYDEAGANDAALRQMGEISAKEENKLRKQNAALFKSGFSREDCFLLGHVLGFSLAEMEFFMLRSLDEEEGIHFRSSTDLIECFGFLAGYSWYQVEALREEYAARFADIPKAEDAGAYRGITREVSDNLPALVEEWQRRPETMRENFLHYLELGAPYLDCPSVSGTTVYRNLAAWALDLMDEKQITPLEDEFLDCMDDVISIRDPEALAEQAAYYGDWENCRAAAERLVKQNQVQAASRTTDPVVSWRVLHVDKDGSLTPEGGLIRRADRIAELLAGKTQVEKADLLYLIWFIANFVWQSSDSPDENDIFCRICDFREIANIALEAAALTASFHVPHLMESSMLLSIVSGVRDNDPAVVYEQLMGLFTKTRTVTQKAKNHSNDDQLAIILEYRSSGKKLKDFAKEKGVSDKTISYWQKKLVEKGLIEAK